MPLNSCGQEAIRKEIAIYSGHTNFDAVSGGSEYLHGQLGWDWRIRIFWSPWGTAEKAGGLCAPCTT